MEKLSFNIDMRKVEELPARLVTFAEIFAQTPGIKAAAAARMAGYKGKHAEDAYLWIRKTRDTSRYPELWDYWNVLKKERLRLQDLTIDRVTDELKLMAFSSIDNFLELPKREIHEQIEKLEDKKAKITKAIEKFYDPETGKYQPGALLGVKKIGAIQKRIEKLQREPGFLLKLKFIEDIPPELIPAIAEIRDTRDGISVKLHSKLDAIDKLCRWLGMYKDDKQSGEVAPAAIKEVHLFVNGSRSKLLDDEQQSA